MTQESSFVSLTRHDSSNVSKDCNPGDLVKLMDNLSNEMGWDLNALVEMVRANKSDGISINKSDPYRTVEIINGIDTVLVNVNTLSGEMRLSLPKG